MVDVEMTTKSQWYRKSVGSLSSPEQAIHPSASLFFTQENPFRMEFSVVELKSLIARKTVTSYCHEWCHSFFQIPQSVSKLEGNWISIYTGEFRNSPEITRN